MGEIFKPATKKYWMCHNEDGSVMAFGETEPNQVTTSGQPVLQGCDTEEELVTLIANKDVDLFPVIPNEGEKCEYLKVYRYGNDKAKCLQEHTRMHFAPEDTPALWLIIPTITGDYPVWKQPTGAHDAYQKGDKVHFPTLTDPVYESLIDANVWSPTVYPAGWKKI
jgi:hypothetical protein